MSSGGRLPWPPIYDQNPHLTGLVVNNTFPSPCERQGISQEMAAILHPIPSITGFHRVPSVTKQSGLSPSMNHRIIQTPILQIVMGSQCYKTKYPDFPIEKAYLKKS